MFNSTSNIPTFLEFCRGILFLNKKFENCEATFLRYGEMLQLKGKAEKKHFLIAKRICSYVIASAQFEFDRSQESKRIIYHLAVRYAVCIELNSFSEETKACKGGICKRISILNTVSRINHSCSPNLHHYIDENNTMHCVVVRPVKKGDQLFINYISNDCQQKKIQNPQAYLKENWDFGCECDKCELNILIGNDGDSSFQYIKQNFKKLSLNNVNQLQQECVNYLQKFGSTWTTAVEFVVNCLISIINEF